LLAALGHPEQALAPVIHVAGTNGKGSVVAGLRAILEAAGRRVHVYTSPHLVRFNERIRLNGRLIDDAVLAALLEECERVNRGMPITFFEITTAAAMLAFARAPADVVVLETGLGGRLDATNVVARPAAVAITPVSLDHQSYLGDSIEAIAAEKAGILKAGVPAVIGPQAPAALAVMRARALSLGAPLWVFGEQWSVRPQAGGFDYGSIRGRMWLPAPALPGRHQIDNAGTALAVIEQLDQWRVPAASLRAAMAAITWPARLQKLARGPLAALLPPDWELWVDGGHNGDAGRALAAWAAGLAGERPLHLVMGMLNSKQPEEFLTPLSGHIAAARMVAIPGEANALDPGLLAQAARALGIRAAAAVDVPSALAELASGGGGPARVLVAGSLYLAGHVLSPDGAPLES